MDNGRFDRLARALTPGRSRRAVTRLLGGVAAGSVLAPLGFGESVAEKHKRKKKPKIKRNDFGCVNINNACKDSGQCCSGICAGKKGKTRCQAHNEGGCTPERSFCVTGSVLSQCGNAATNGCFATSGNAGFCADPVGGTSAVNCQICRTDIDCEDLGFPLGSACVIQSGGPGCSGASDCNGINGSKGTACFPPGA